MPFASKIWNEILEIPKAVQNGIKYVCESNL